MGATARAAAPGPGTPPLAEVVRYSAPGDRGLRQERTVVGRDKNQHEGAQNPTPGEGGGPITRIQGFRTTGDVDQAALARARKAAATPEPAPEGEPWAEDPDPMSSEADALRALTAAPMLGLDDGEALTGPAEERYETLGELGVGAMGLVLRVRDRALSREVAMKTLRQDRRDSPEHARALLREARLIGNLEHPAIIPVHDVGTLRDGSPYYTMRLLPPASLADVITRLRSGGPVAAAAFDLRRLVRIVVQIAQGLDHAHGRGVVHRDLKPGNILLGELGEVRIMDWGIAKRMTASPSSSPSQAEGLVFGTPAYMSPEQAQGQDSRVDHRSDIYSLGVIFYELLTLRRPYAGKGSRQQIAAASSVPPPLPSAVSGARHVPVELEGLVMQMLARNPTDRPATMRQIWQVLERFLAGVLEQTRREEQAEDCFQRALDELERYQNMLAEREGLQVEQDRLQRLIRPWDDQSAKQKRWRLRHRLQRLEVLIAHAFGIATELLRRAVDSVGHPEARNTLSELYWHRHDAAEAVDDSATKLFFARLAHDLEGDEVEGAIGVLHIRSSPPGAVVWAVPFHEYDDPGTGTPGAQFEIGVTPITDCELPVGPYVIIARLDGHREAQEACYVRRRGADMLLLLDPWSRDLPITGREVALARLWSLAFDMEMGARVVTCRVSGPPGMGKNRLLDAFRAEVKEHPTRLYIWLEVNCVPLRRDLPYAVLVELLRLRAAVMASDTAAEMRQKVHRMVLQAWSRFGRRELSKQMHGEAVAVADQIAALPAFDLVDPDRAALDAAAWRVEGPALATALAAYFRELAACSPVQILIRNAQYMDDASRDLLATLLAQIHDAPILLLATVGRGSGEQTTRPAAPPSGRRAVPPLAFDAEVVLGQLPDETMDQLVREMLAAPVDASLLSWLRDRSRGIPFLAAELISVLRREGVMTWTEAGWVADADRLPDLAPGDMPAAVRALIRTLPEQASVALAVAAVIGPVFWRGVLRELGVDRIDSALGALVERGLITRNATTRYDGEQEYALASSLRWRVAYDMSRPQRRRELHRRTASWLARKGRADLEETLAIAHHLEMGGQPEEAAILLQRVAQAAMSAGAQVEARRLYVRVHLLTDDAQMQDVAERALRQLADAQDGASPEGAPS